MFACSHMEGGSDRCVILNCCNGIVPIFRNNDSIAKYFILIECSKSYTILEENIERAPDLVL